MSWRYLETREDTSSWWDSNKPPYRRADLSYSWRTAGHPQGADGSPLKVWTILSCLRFPLKTILKIPETLKGPRG